MIAVKPDHVPIARPRSAGGNDALMSARLPGTSSAAPTPCRARAAISSPIDRDRPHHTDAAAKTATPPANTLRRPRIAQRAAGQEQRRQRQRVGFDHPLHLGQRRVERGLQRGKRDVDDGAVDERQARSEDGGGQHPAAAATVRSSVPVRIAASSQGGLTMTAMLSECSVPARSGRITISEGCTSWVSAQRATTDRPG